MADVVALSIFAFTWWFLLAVAVIAQVMTQSIPLKRQAGPITNALIVTPFVLALGLFFLGRYFGSYQGTPITRGVGAAITCLGLIAYTASHLYLRKNWSMAASIKEGHVLITGGPYRVVRHPMYSSMILVVLGSGLLADNSLMIVSTVFLGLVYYLRARKEEEFLGQEFPGYRDYVKRTKMLVPWLA